MRTLLENTGDYMIRILMHNFLHNNSQQTSNNYELATVLKVILVNLPDQIFPYITPEDVLILDNSQIDPIHDKSSCSEPSNLRYSSSPTELSWETRIISIRNQQRLQY